MNKGKIEQVGTPEDVYHNPANVFVLNFLGNVNLFHARIEEGNLAAKAKKMYVRPHELSVTRNLVSANSIKARITFINPAGAVVKIDALAADGQAVQAEISQEDYKNLKLIKNEEICLTPKNITYSEYDI
jgi:sulfate transport system ATP-binding protein